MTAKAQHEARQTARLNENHASLSLQHTGTFTQIVWLSNRNAGNRASQAVWSVGNEQPASVIDRLPTFYWGLGTFGHCRHPSESSFFPQLLLHVGTLGLWDSPGLRSLIGLKCGCLTVNVRAKRCCRLAAQHGLDSCQQLEQVDPPLSLQPPELTSRKLGFPCFMKSRRQS